MLKKFDTKIATVKKFYANQLDEQRLLSKKTSTIISKTREKAIFEGIRSNYNTLIFDDGLQDSRIEYDLKFVCFKSKNWIGNGQLIPSGPMRENISSLKGLMQYFWTEIQKILMMLINKLKKLILG